MDAKSYRSLCQSILQCRSTGTTRMDIQSDIRPLPQSEQSALSKHLIACGAIKNGDFWDFTAVDPGALSKITEIKTPKTNLTKTTLSSPIGTWRQDADGSWRFSYNQNCPDSGVSYDSSGHLHFDL